MAAFPEDDGLTPLSVPENRLLAAARTGEILRLEPEETIRASVIRALVCTAVDAWPVAAEGVRIISGQIIGRLALAGRTLHRPLWINDADIPAGIDLTASQMCQISFEKSRISGGILALDAKIQGNFLLDGAVIKGVCDISSTDITGQFSANGATFDNATEDSIYAQGSRVEGIFLNNAIIKGTCDINSSTIAAQFSAIGASFDNPDGHAINAHSICSTGIFLDNATLKGICNIGGARISGQFSANGATFEGIDGTAIRADFAQIGAWFMRAASTGSGGASQPTCIRGSVILVRATISRHFEISGAKLDHHQVALDARGIETFGAFIIGNGTQVAGCIDFAAAAVRGRLDLTGSRIVAAIQARDLDWSPDLANDATSFTALDLSEARIDHLVMPMTTDTRPLGIIDMSRARVGTLTDFAAAWPPAADRKTKSCKSRFRDKTGRDADHLVLDGLEYEHLDNPDGLPPGEHASPRRLAKIRRDWLHAQSCEDVFDRLKPQPWRHLSRILAAQGYEEESRRVAIERRVAQRYTSGTGRAARGLSWLLHKLADYGFNPWKALAWSGGVIAICAVVYGVAAGYCSSVTPICADETVFVRTTAADFVPAMSDLKEAQAKLAATYPAFEPIAYSLDVFLPFVDLGTERFWRVNTTTRWGLVLYYFTILEQIAGALLVSLVVTGFTGLLTRNEA